MSSTIRIGFWRSSKDSKEDLPWPEVSRRMLFPEARNKILYPCLEFLERGHPIAHYKGKAKCRICGADIGSTLWQCGHFVYPVGYLHYLVKHWVEPDPLLVSHIQHSVRDLAWFDSLDERDFQNGAVRDEIRRAFQELEKLKRKKRE